MTKLGGSSPTLRTTYGKILVEFARVIFLRVLEKRRVALLKRYDVGFVLA